MIILKLLRVIVAWEISLNIDVLSVSGIIENIKHDVCDANQVELERCYELHLVMENINHSDFVFSMYFTGIR
ncbi:hypothetical protein SAMN05877753_101392 [Bacillus oleivorans]|uniref:Uncharacterized protein n=1 Tax=Bacillus oleivorans TaxID=1448271 RepID=A0A285CHJ3_9BACI|nr:hypothetical protein SAMN05877753_101392 [Bacillus oleivorans]